ncbi:MAG: Tau-tubulin kinase 2 [Marteilia pararefringens]
MAAHVDKASNIPDMASSGEILSTKYCIISRVGSGAFGQVYKAEILKGNEEKERIICAIKIEHYKAKRKVLQTEALIMEKLQDHPVFMKIYDYERILNKYYYVVMELATMNLKEFASRQPNKVLSEIQGGNAMMKLISAIEYMHSTGFVHRDIKTGNIVTMKSESLDDPCLKIIDLGLARRILEPDNSLREKRPDGKVPFRGTKVYASINQLEKNDFSRADDMINLFNSTLGVTMRIQLPWSKVEEVDKQIELRRTFEIRDTRNPGSLYETTYQRFWKEISNLEYEDTPKYAKCIELFRPLSGKKSVSDRHVMLGVKKKNNKTINPNVANGDKSETNPDIPKFNGDNNMRDIDKNKSNTLSGGWPIPNLRINLEKFICTANR